MTGAISESLNAKYVKLITLGTVRTGAIFS